MFTVTLNELQTIADNLRPYTADAMTIEVAPWIQDYVVDMDDLYTELALEKIHNKVAWQDVKELNHYAELFDKCDSDEKVDSPDSGVQESLPVKTLRNDSHISISGEANDLNILMNII